MSRVEEIFREMVVRHLGSDIAFTTSERNVPGQPSCMAVIADFPALPWCQGRACGKVTYDYEEGPLSDEAIKHRCLIVIEELFALGDGK